MKKLFLYWKRHVCNFFWAWVYVLFPAPQIRRWLLLSKAQSVGVDVQYQLGFDVFGNGKVYIGDRVNLFDLFINAVEADVRIGDDSFFGHRVMLLTGTHDYKKLGFERQTAISGNSIQIGAGVWVGSGAIVLGGVQIGDHSVIAAGAVVAHDIPSGVIAGGIPAKVIKNLN